MSATSEKLWLHMYAGKEHGLMVVGSASALKSLGQNLIDASPDTKIIPKGWPSQIVSVDVDGPYKDVTDFKLSFHLQGKTPSEEILPLKKSTLNFYVYFVIACLTIVGIKSTLQWLISWLS